MRGSPVRRRGDERSPRVLDQFFGQHRVGQPASDEKRRQQHACHSDLVVQRAVDAFTRLVRGADHPFELVRGVLQRVVHDDVVEAIGLPEL